MLAFEKSITDAFVHVLRDNMAGNLFFMFQQSFHVLTLLPLVTVCWHIVS